MTAKTGTRTTYLETAEVAVRMLRDPAVAAAWERPSALAKLSVGGLAAHLARQVHRVSEVVAAPAPETSPIPLLEHYHRSAWLTADIDDGPNVAIRQAADSDAGGGTAAVAERTEAALRKLREVLPAEPVDRLVQLPWGPWSLTLDDLLVTRLVELTVHCDDLAVSVGVATPELPAAAYEQVLPLLCRLAAGRHGPVAVLRALSRAERAPATISAF